MKSWIWCLILILAFTPSVQGYEPLSTIFVDGNAQMIMDGKLDDWTIYNVPEIPAMNELERTRDVSYKLTLVQGAADCAFSFKCFADRNYVYFALIVKDDDIVIGSEPFGRGGWEDTCTIFFDGDCKNPDKYYYDSNDGMIKVVGTPPDGVAWIEGKIPYIKNLQFPYFWEARGVKAGYHRTNEGYITEVAIPAIVLGWEIITPGQQMRANLRVVDEDSYMDVNTQEKGYLWVPDPEYVEYFSSKPFNTIVFAKSVPASEGSLQVTQTTETAEGVNVILGAPDYSEGGKLFDTAITYIGNDDFASAEATLLPRQDELWVKPFLSAIQLKEGKFAEAANNLALVSEMTHDLYVKDWVRTFVQGGAQVVYDQFKGKNDTSAETIKENMVKIQESFYQKQTDPVLLYDAGILASKAAQYDSAIGFFSQVEQKSSDQNVVYKARLERARNLFFKKEYTAAKQVAEELKSYITEPAITLGASMLLMSIEANQQ